MQFKTGKMRNRTIKTWKKSIKKKAPASLQTQLYAAYLAVILLVLVAFSVFFYVFVSQKLIRQEINTLYNGTLTIKEAIEQSVEDMNTVSININYSSIVKSKLSGDFNLRQNGDTYRELAELFVMMNGTDSRVDYIYLYDMNDNCLQVDAVQNITRVDLQNEVWFQEAVKREGSPYLSVPYTKTVSSYTTTCLSLYRTYVNSMQQIVGIVETAKQAKSVFSPIVRYQKNTIAPPDFYIYNERSELVYPYTKESEQKERLDNDVDYTSLIQSSAYLQNHIYRAILPDSEERVYICALYAPLTGWTYYAVQKEAVILSPLNALMRMLAVFVAVLAVLSVILSHYLSRRLVRPIAHLKHIIQRMRFSSLGKENPDSYPVFTREIKELYNSFSEMNTELKSSRDELISLHEAELEARSLALQSQMSPHFYHNSLASIMILAENGDSDAVITMSQKLSNIMRYVSDFKTRVVSIGRELDYIREYLYCMKVRNQSSLAYAINVPQTLLERQIPKLCIHPFVENALKYGTDCEPPWKIDITGERTDQLWKISVQDSGPGFSDEALIRLHNILTAADTDIERSQLSALQINGLGIVNSYIRLTILFGEKLIFEYGNDENGHARVTVGAYF